jgi:hypothetical protein
MLQQGHISGKLDGKLLLVWKNNGYLCVPEAGKSMIICPKAAGAVPAAAQAAVPWREDQLVGNPVS